MHVNTGSHRCSPYFVFLFHIQISLSARKRCEKRENTGGVLGAATFSRHGSQTERTFIRILIGTALCIAILTAVLAPASEPPATALGQPWLFRLEVSLLAFYGCLLLITPAFSGLIRGRLPTEISTRGAKFAEETGRAEELTDAKIEELERTTDTLAERLIDAHAEIEQLRSETVKDSTQREVDSRR
jgi:hypothetical protein